MSQLYGLTARTAEGLRGLLADGGSIGGRATSGAAARGATWVKVTGSPTSGWYPAVVSIDDDGTFTDLADAVKVASSDGSALTSGTRYLCTRTGDATDGSARFRTKPAPVTSSLWKTPAAKFAMTAALPACTYSNGASGVGATLTANSNGAFGSIDGGVSVALNDRILVNFEATTAYRGLYVLTQMGDSFTPWVLTRATDADSPDELAGATVHVTDGFKYHGTTWQCMAGSASAITMGSTGLPWRQLDGIVAQTVDGSPRYLGIREVWFNEASGFVLTNPSGGEIAQVDIQRATQVLPGIVTGAAGGLQHFGGDKEFWDSVGVRGSLRVDGGAQIAGLGIVPPTGGAQIIYYPSTNATLLAPYAVSPGTIPIGDAQHTLVLSDGAGFGSYISCLPNHDSTHGGSVWIVPGQAGSSFPGPAYPGRLVLTGAYAVAAVDQTTFTTTVYTGDSGVNLLNQKFVNGICYDMGTGVPVPATWLSAGRPGQTTFDFNYFYVCVNTNQWKRIPLPSTTW